MRRGVVGTGLARQRCRKPPCFTGVGFPFAREKRVEGRGRGRGWFCEFLGWFQSRRRGWNGMEWNGVERSGRRAARGLSRGPEIDNAIPRLPLPPSTKLAPALLSFLLFCFPLSLPPAPFFLRLFLSRPPRPCFSAVPSFSSFLRTSEF